MPHHAALLISKNITKVRATQASYSTWIKKQGLRFVAINQRLNRILISISFWTSTEFCQTKKNLVSVLRISFPLSEKNVKAHRKLSIKKSKNIQPTLLIVRISMKIISIEKIEELINWIMELQHSPMLIKISGVHMS